MLKRHATQDSELARKLAYVHAFHIVPEQVGLRAGHVRDVARGEIFIHRRWTNDVWLLWGQVLRRSPWIFDPRYLRRPFYYRTESNRLMTLCVLQHARYSVPYAIFQFGHEIKAARYDAFYRLGQWLGFKLEGEVRADGTYEFDPLIRWLRQESSATAYPLWTDDETIHHILTQCSNGETVSALDIAVRYTYPLKYVEEVLWAKIPH